MVNKKSRQSYDNLLSEYNHSKEKDVDTKNSNSKDRKNSKNMKTSKMEEKYPQATPMRTMSDSHSCQSLTSESIMGHDRESTL